jgi:ribosomal protein L21
MKKAVLKIGGNQYLVSEGQVLEVELIKDTDIKLGKMLELQPLLVIDGSNLNIGKSILETQKVTVEIVETDILVDKKMSIRYKAKKRVHKVQGSRQHHSRIKITSIN